MHRFVIATLIACAACANPGLPAYRTSRPPPLAPIGAPRPTRTVRIEMKSLPWWTVAGDVESFILGFDDAAAAAVTGHRVGAVRSRDIDLSDDVFTAVRCAWLVVPLGDPRPCSATTRRDAMVIARDAIAEARAELRAHAGDAGAGAVSDVRCFAERELDKSRLWCEGVALVTPAQERDSLRGDGMAQGSSPGDQEPDASIDNDPAAPIDHEPRLPGTRLVLVADASVGMLGNQPVVGSSLGLRYRPFEFALYMLDLQREGLTPRDDGVVGIGLTVLARIALGHSRADVIVGGSSVAAAVNNTTNPTFDSLYHGFAGLAYQTRWRIAGAAQPFVQLRAGAAYGSLIAARTVPMFELHLGLTSPERR